MSLLLNLVFQLTFLDVLMEREGPEEFSIWSACFVCLFVRSFVFASGFCVL